MLQAAMPHVIHHVPITDDHDADLDGEIVTLDIPWEIRTRLSSPEMIRVSECARKYRYVTGVDAEPGPWRHSTVPHAVKAMDVCGLPWVREVWICGVERSAKTQVLLNYAQWSVKYKPGNIFWLEPTEEDVGKNIKTKIIPMFREAHEKTEYGNYLSDRADDTGKGLITFRNGVHLFPAHSNSARSMSNFFGQHNLANEVDKYPLTTGPETGPINLIYKRGRDAHDPTYVFASTPAGRFIYKGMLKCRQIWTWGLRCPHCHEIIIPDDDHLDIPPGATAEEIKNEVVAVGYSCNVCGVVWTEQDRQDAYRSGRDVCLKGADVDRATTVGFHWPSLNIGRVPLAETAEKYLLSKGSDLAAKRDYSHGYKAVDYEEEIATAPQLAGLADRAEHYAPIVPMAAGLLTAGADVQGDRIEIEVVAWGVGAESWGIENEVFWGDTSLPEVWDQFDTYLMQTWRHESGEQLGIARLFLDSGYRSHMVYKFTGPRLARGLFAIKGAKDYDAREIAGPTKQKYGGGRAHLFTLGTQKLKTMMFGFFGLAQPGPGYCHIPDTYGSEWFDGLQTEHLITRTVGGRAVSTWEIVKQGLRNEPIDKRVYALAALLSMRVNLKEKVAELKAIAAEQRPKKQKRSFTVSKGVKFDD
jgi:phage terminase large subunit GpA-like protein